MDKDSPILFFDGVCGLCNRFVDFLIARDRGSHLKFAPLQGQTAAAMLPPDLRGAGPNGVLDTVVLKDAQGIHLRSQAALRALAELGGAWRLVLVLLLCPQSFRDWIYDQVAHNRYAWFGKKDSCRLPSPEERARFLA